MCVREGERPLLLHFARHLLGIWPTPSPHDCAIESDLSSLDSEFCAVTNELMFLSRLCLAGKRYHRSVVRGHPKGVRPSCPSLTTTRTPSLPSVAADLADPSPARSRFFGFAPPSRRKSTVVMADACLAAGVTAPVFEAAAPLK